MSTIPPAVPLIPRDVLFGNPEKDAPRISPDGERLAYLAPSHGTMSVWVRTIGKTDDRVIAHDAARPIPWFAWQGDGQHVLYLQDRGGNENYHLFQAGLRGEAVRELTPGDRVRAQPLAIDPRHPGEMLVMSNARDETAFDVLRVDLIRGEAALDTRNPGDVVGWLHDHALVVRAAVAKRPDGSSEIRIREDAESPWRTLDQFSFEDGTPGAVAFSPDNRSLYVTTAKDWNSNRLVRYDVATGACTSILEDDTYGVERVYLDPATQRVVAAAVLRERLQWQVLEEDFAIDFATLDQLHAGDVMIESASADGSILVVQCLDDTKPTAYYSYDRRERRESFLFYTQAELTRCTLAPMESFAFTARDGLQVHGYLTLPVGVEARNLPTVLYVHGGPWYRDRWGYEPMVQWMANRGYAVVQVNFRGSTGYGKGFLNAGNLEWAGAMRTDLLDARNWAVARGLSDPGRFAILGGSYGGYAVLAALAFTPDAFTCGVDIVGPSNLNTLLAAIPPYWKAMRSLFTRRMGEDPAFLESQSPLVKAGDIKAPLLIAHGANDPRVKQQESDQIVEVLRKNHVAVTYLVFEDEGHGFANPANNKRFTALAEAFLGQHLGGRIEAPHPGEEIQAFLR